MTFLKSLTVFCLLAISHVLWAAENPGAPDASASSGSDAGNGGRGRIVVLGDSITAGYGLDPIEAYPALLQQKIDSAGLPYTVTNAGVSGDTTAGGSRRINWALGSAKTDVLIVALGGNDGLRGIAPPQTAENLAAIIQKARAKSPAVTVILAGMQMPGNMGADYTEKFRAIYPKLAAEQKTELVPFLLEGVGGLAEFNQADLIHPNVEGQKRVAENVWSVLQKVLSSQRAP